MIKNPDNYCDSCGHNIGDHQDGAGCLALHNDDRNKFSMNILAKRVCECNRSFTINRKKLFSINRGIKGPKKKLWEVLADVR